MGNGYGMNGGMGWGWIFGLLAIVGVTLLVILAVRFIGGGVRRGPDASAAPLVKPTPSGHERPRQILAERYARGEIDTTEYRERLEHLQDE
ncbi:SHOCT domain-containing protein [Sanguibacter antarcticus]|uniref:Putative membrane protein n=1 Tax=Sanguibacter antarcticus TaxID=372484 RepID=A0A2A9E0F1_9MICO|nr:hypothetical protein [Sanguibacter antarcticus]PFG32408.1 putative membrane protein [Sanguibacter antarcticus]